MLFSLGSFYGLTPPTNDWVIVLFGCMPTKKVWIFAHSWLVNHGFAGFFPFQCGDKAKIWKIFGTEARSDIYVNWVGCFLPTKPATIDAAHRGFMEKAFLASQQQARDKIQGATQKRITKCKHPALGALVEKACQIATHDTTSSKSFCWKMSKYGWSPQEAKHSNILPWGHYSDEHKRVFVDRKLKNRQPGCDIKNFLQGLGP